MINCIKCCLGFNLVEFFGVFVRQRNIKIIVNFEKSFYYYRRRGNKSLMEMGERGAVILWMKCQEKNVKNFEIKMIECFVQCSFLVFFVFQCIELFYNFVRYKKN